MDANRIIIATDSTFSFAECLWYLDRNFDDCMHTVGDSAVKKALLIQGKPVLIDITAGNNSIRAEIIKGEDSSAIRREIKDFLVDWFDLDRDLIGFYQLLKKDKRLSYMVADFQGLRLIGIPDLFEALSWSIIGQQINLPFAYKIKRRLVEKYGISVEYDHLKYHIFPSCEVLARVTVEELREMQLSTKKAEYLITVAQAFADETISKAKLRTLPDFKTRQNALTVLRGIGIWTANYALMKSMKEQVSIPYGDAGLLNALLSHGIIRQKTDASAIDRFFKKFPGWESYMVFYLWRSLSAGPSEKSAPGVPKVSSAHREK